MYTYEKKSAMPKEVKTSLIISYGYVSLQLRLSAPHLLPFYNRCRVECILSKIQVGDAVYWVLTKYHEMPKF